MTALQSGRIINMESFNVPLIPTDSTAHDAEMAAKFDAGSTKLGAAPIQPTVAGAGDTQPSTAPEPVSKILGKFNTVDDLATAYSELEKRLGANAKPTETPTAAVAAAETSLEIPEVTPAVPAGLSGIMPDLQAEFAANGELSEDAYVKLAAHGLDKSIVDSYIAGQVAQRSAAEAAVYQSIGGKENYSAMTQWAATSMTPAQVESFNKAVTGDAASRELAVSGLYAQYTAATGVAPKLLTGGSVSDSVGYASKAQMVAAMSDPRYRTDPAYRNAVQQKLAVSFNN
jgi:hypothetical protein